MLAIAAIVFLTVFSPTLSAPRPKPQESAQPAMPVINWGKCPELAPKPNEKETKANIIKGCLSSIPLPTNITQEAVERHRTAVAKCALAKENWFTPEGRYKFDKAATEVRNKRLKSDLETSILNQHTQCRSEAENQFKEVKDVINQVQLYQACMDYHISQICAIQITGGQQAGRPRDSQ